MLLGNRQRLAKLNLIDPSTDFPHYTFSSSVRDLGIMLLSRGSPPCLPIHLPIHLPICLSICLPVCMFICLLMNLPIWLPICLSVCLPVCYSSRGILFASMPSVSLFERCIS